EWSQIDVGLGDTDLFAVHGIDSENIVITGASAKSAIFDGNSWTTYSSGSRDMLGVWMLAPDNIWAGAKGGRIYSFDGTSWTELVLGNRDWRSIQFLDSETGYIVGRNGNLAAFNGTLWELAASGTGNDLSDIHLFDENSGYIVGNDGIVISYQGDGFNSEYLKSFSVGSNLLEYRLSNLLFGKNHYFRMRTKHAASTSDWSSAASFVVISNPTLKTPANNATGIILDPTLTWDPISGAARYTMEIASNVDFSDPWVYETNETTYTVAGLSFGQDYYWRVNARHAGGVSDWSAPFKFNTISTVNLTAPANNAIDVARVPRFTWEEIHGAQKYMVALDKASDFPNGEIEVVEHNYWQHMFMLDPLATYFWRVKAIQGLDTTDWSQTWSFTTANETSVDEQLQQAFKLYPNPASDYIQLKIESPNFQQASLEIYNIIGSRIFVQEITFGSDSQMITIPLEDFKSGLYFVKLIDGSNAFTQRLIIE
ncbi:MAG TPA: T9SS type A sorting domain-containing protein, partial [Bacteroidales bacterium]|nr:T9SS type A sorting domain-containing protein [Bacteroidales bacterium]